MNIINPLVLSSLAGLSTVLGSLFIFFKVKKVGEFIVVSLSFSMTIMLIVSLFELLPESIPVLLNYYNNIGYLIVALVFILGYLTIYMINKFIDDSSSLYKIGILSLISLMLHNFPEGIAVFMSTYASSRLGLKIFFSIICHNIPEGISISVPLYYSGKSRARVVVMTLLSGIAEPIGALLSYYLLIGHINDIILSYVLIFVSGLMISLSINEILKEILNYKLNKYIIHGILIGIILSIVIFVI